jgi:hypothetical protein
LSEFDERFQKVQALSTALDPLIDYCLAHGVHTAELESMVRVEFVKRAAALLPGTTRTKGKPSHEAIGLASGLGRGEVQNILSSGGAAASLRMKNKWEKHTTSEKLLQEWATDMRFLSQRGAPLDLPLDPQDDGPSFTELVQSSLPGKSPRHVLRELRRRGLVEQLADEIIRYRQPTTTALASSITNKALEYAAEQQSLLGRTLLETIERPSKTDFRHYLASAPVELPVDDLQVSRASVRRRMAALTRGFELEFGQRAGQKQKGVGNRSKTTVKPNKMVNVGICVFTWQSK